MLEEVFEFSDWHRRGHGKLIQTLLGFSHHSRALALFCDTALFRPV